MAVYDYLFKGTHLANKATKEFLAQNRTKNPFTAVDRYIYFFSYPPYLMKTTVYKNDMHSLVLADPMYERNLMPPLWLGSLFSEGQLVAAKSPHEKILFEEMRKNVERKWNNGMHRERCNGG